MSTILLIAFTITLLYFAIANRMMTCVSILVMQGIIICGLALNELHEMNWLNLAIILLETLVVKAWVMPLFVRRVIIKNHITREAEPSVPQSVSLGVVSAIIVATNLISYYVAQKHACTLNMGFFVTALTAIFSGLFFIASRRKIITHVICYVIVENGAFILSLAIGQEMPAVVNLGVLLDVLVSVFLLAIFINKVGDVTSDGDVEKLTTLKD